MLFQKLNFPSPADTSNEFLKNRSMIGTSIATDIVSVFLSELSFIKNIGNKKHTIIVFMQLITNIGLKLYTNKVISEVKLSFVKSTTAIKSEIVPRETDIKTYK